MSTPTPSKSALKAADDIYTLDWDDREEFNARVPEVAKLIDKAMQPEREEVANFMRNLVSNLDSPESLSREQLIWKINTTREVLNKALAAIEKVLL